MAKNSTTSAPGPFDVSETKTRIEVRSTLSHRIRSAVRRALVAGSAVFLLATIVTIPDLIAELGSADWMVRLGSYAAVGFAVTLAYGIVRGLRHMTWSVDRAQKVLSIDEYGAGPARQWEIPFEDIVEFRSSDRAFGTGVEVVLEQGDAYPLGIASWNRAATDEVVQRANRILSTEP